MKKFRIKQYEIHTDKIHAPQGVRMILLADLHGISYGKDNIRLTETIRKLAPDVILSAGDMAVRTETSLPEIFPCIMHLAIMNIKCSFPKNTGHIMQNMKEH